MFRIFSIIIVFTLLMATSCEEDYVLVQGHFTPKVVVNCVFTENETFKVNLSESRDIFSNEPGFRYISNAVVTIKEIASGRVEELAHTGEGNYTYTFLIAKPEYLYELQVKVPGHPTIQATSKVPRKVSNVQIFTENIVHDEKATLQVKFNIKDQNSGYYVWNWFTSNLANPIDSSAFPTHDKLVSSINKVRNINLKGYEDSNLGIKENGNEFRKTFLITDGLGLEGSAGSPEVGDKNYLRIISLSKELYDFYVSVEKYLDNPNQISSISYLPKVYTNIQNGLGIFAGYSQKYIEDKK